ncbi:DUF342 domain-containing protein [candidate division GN15 bacterium]|nr:DUF342 domain-containing protein [candidate division GN15 bacterium]
MADTAATQNRTRVSITISKDHMTASIFMRKPKAEEEAITVEEVMEALKASGVVFGIEDDMIAKAVTEGMFNTPVRVAIGRKPQRGQHAQFEYNFNTSESHKPKEDEDGHIDYRDINFIQNTEAGAVLATKTPPTEGEPGMSVLGKEIKGPEGRDIPFNQGSNTEVSEDGLQLLASASGAIQFTNGKVSVKDVITIRGDVDHNVGNIDCKGSVHVTGHVRAGYELRMDGDLVVDGNVEDANIDVKGNVFIKGGFFGEGKGVMKAGGDVVVKFAEGQRIFCGNEMTAGAEIVNCAVQARERIHVKGRRGKIVGGDLRAGKEIRASIIGSEAGGSTKVTVAFDVELMKRYSEVVKEIERLNEDKGRVKEALYALYRLQMEGKLPEEKKQALAKLETFQQDLPGNLETLEKQKAQLEAALSKFKDARIIAEEVIYPGVKAYFGIVYRDMLEERTQCVLTLENNKILASTWNKSADEK